MSIHPIEEIIEDIRLGKMVVMMDDEDRENEGDVIMAAEKVTPQHINFMARFARGLVCLPLTKARCEQLRLPLMVADNHSKFGTNFTLSIEAASGVTTGISAPDRAHTILTAVNTANPHDIVQPGHIFPIMAQEGGVLVRAGHTEASIDMARLAGLKPAAVLCEILNEDGTMARRPQLEQFAKEHGLKLGTIADLIRYRLTREPTLVEMVRQSFTTAYGSLESCVFHDKVTGLNHVALVAGKIAKTRPAWVRVHIQHPLLDIAGIKSEVTESWPLGEALAFIAAEGEGAVVILNRPPLTISDWQTCLSDDPNCTHSASNEEEWRQIGIGSQILSLLGFGKIRLLGPKKHYCALSGFDLEVVEYLPYAQQALKRNREHGIELA